MNRFESAFRRVLEACGAGSAILVLVVTVVITSNVVLRAALGTRVPGDVDISEYAMMLITVLAAPLLLHKGQHVRIDLLLHRLPAVMGWSCEILVDILGIAMSGLMAWYGSRVFLATIADGTSLVKEFTIPEWWVRWSLPMMFVLATVEFFFRLRRVLRGPRQPRHEGGVV